MKDEFYKYIFVFIFGMGLGSGLNGLYYGNEIDNLNKSIIEFNIAQKEFYGIK
ncbi:MAG: hypothetical protein L3I99_05610 [Sulfurimonas sp.]|nr:hypothetical protein [Sulfurimonas sp.]